MIYSFHKTTATSLALLTGFAFARLVQAGDTQRSFSVEPGDLLVVDIERAEINVSAWHRSEISFSADEAEHIAFEFNASST